MFRKDNWVWVAVLLAAGSEVISVSRVQTADVDGEVKSSLTIYDTKKD